MYVWMDRWMDGWMDVCMYVCMTYNLHRKIKLTITRYLKGTNLKFASTNFYK